MQGIQLTLDVITHIHLQLEEAERKSSEDGFAAEKQRLLNVEKLKLRIAPDRRIAVGLPVILNGMLFRDIVAASLEPLVVRQLCLRILRLLYLC